MEETKENAQPISDGENAAVDAEAGRKKEKKRIKQPIGRTVPANKKGRHVMPLMNVLRAIVIPVFRIFKPFRCYGHTKTKDGACVYVGNHYTIWDPIYIARTTTEGIHFLSKREVTQHWLMSGICKKIRCISVNRDGNDARAFMNSLKCLKNGEKVSIFPEGTRNKTDAEMLPFKPGAAALAVKAKVPVVPVAIYKKPRLFRTAHILYGEPFELSEFYDKKLSAEDLKTADDIIKEKLLSLKRGHAAFLQEKKRGKKRGGQAEKQGENK